MGSTNEIVGGNCSCCSSRTLLATEASGARWGEIGVEQVMRIDPDIIVTQQGNGTADILEDPRIQDLKAVKNKAVHECPIGAFWWDRPSPESPLGFMWLAKLLYPDYTREIDLEKEIWEFFREFYRYELTDEEYCSFFGREPIFPLP